MSVSPKGFSLPAGDFVIKLDAWANFNGPLPNGGDGSTENMGCGIGTAGTSAQWQGGTHDSLFFTTTADGGGIDYGAYGPGGLLPSDVLAAGSTNDIDPYYQDIGGVEAPAAQVALFPDQAGETRPGASGLAWREVEIARVGDTVTWTMDGLLLATVEDYSALGVGGDNILLNYYDQYNSLGASPMLFGLVDNISVIPEPSTYAAIFGGLALAGAFIYRRRKNQA